MPSAVTELTEEDKVRRWNGTTEEFASLMLDGIRVHLAKLREEGETIVVSRNGKIEYLTPDQY